ncbi:MAG: MurR/RpiR family transcriptional regulator [Pseudomonadota bacterium]
MTQTAQTIRTAEAVLGLLTQRFEDFSAQLKLAARYIIEHPREVGVQSMRALAARADVHPNTLVRLAQAIGFDGYDAMRERFRDFMVSDGLGGFRDRAAWLRELAAHGGSAEIMAEMARATGDNLENTWQRQDASTLDTVADLILEARQVHVLGVGSAYGLAYQFWYVARMAFEHINAIPRRGGQPIDDLAFAQPDDLLIALTFQPYRSETIQAARLAREIGSGVVGVTDSVTSPLASHADHLLVAPTHTPQFFQSHAAVTALLEGLIAILVSRAGDDIAARIEAFHARRLAVGIYEEPTALAQLG